MVKVRDVMSTGVPQVDYSATVSEACKIMNEEKFSGAIVLHNDKAVGMLTDRALLRRFVALNKKPDEVKVGDVMAPLLKVDAKASTKEAAKRIVENNITRLGVFEGDKFLGWVTLTDLTREFGKTNLIEMLRSHDQPQKPEFLCPNCRKAFMEKVVGDEGDILRWRCPNCKYSL